MPVKIFDPALRVGWEPDAPVDDSILRRFIVNTGHWIEAQTGSLNGRLLERDDLLACDSGRSLPFLNLVLLRAPIFPDGLDETLALLNEFYRFGTDEAVEPVGILSPWPSPDLRPFGWQLMGHPPLMLRPAGGELPPAPPGLRIERVQTIDQLHAAEAIIGNGFEFGEFAPGSIFGPGLLAEERWRAWIGLEGDRPVSAAAVYSAAGINNVSFVATIPEAERRGYGTALTWQATLADPALPSLLFASDPGRPVYERMGYAALFRMTIWYR